MRSDDKPTKPVHVRYPYVVSAVFVTLRYDSRVYSVGRFDDRYLSSIPYLLISLLFGWWGVPWGPLLTLRAVFDCLNGGVEDPAA